MLKHTLPIMLELLQPGHFPRHLHRLLQLHSLVTSDPVEQDLNVTATCPGYCSCSSLVVLEHGECRLPAAATKGCFAFSDKLSHTTSASINTTVHFFFLDWRLSRSIEKEGRLL
jgi:hypothetical protein